MRDMELRNFDDYCTSLRTGRHTSSQLVDAILRYGEADPDGLNAFTLLDGERARRAAEDADRRRAAGTPRSQLDGVPVAVKDNIDLTGLVTTSGFGPRPGRAPAVRDADVVARLRAAGMVVVGRTAMHEGALGATTDNPHFGRCHNPLRHGYTPGGSSGGSAAAVAAGIVPMALGTDTMGSVRLPAAYCGLAGFKPSSGLLSTDGVEPLSWSLDHVGPIAHSVPDLVAAMAVLGPSTPLSTAANSNFTRLRGADLRGLRCARLANFDRLELDPAMHGAFERTCTMLQDAGAHLSTLEIPDYDPSFMRRQGLLWIEAEAAAVHMGEMQRHPEAYSAEFQAMLSYGAEQPAGRLASAMYAIHRLRLTVQACFADYDCIIAPTAMGPAFPFGTPVPVNQADLTALANLADLPAVAFTCGVDAAGLPLSVQLMAAPNHDCQVLDWAIKLEQLLKA